jgi:DNA-binding transcriptional regulator YiaG
MYHAMPTAHRAKTKAKSKKTTNGHAKVSPRVRDIRKKLGLTQQQFATYLGLSTVSVSRWEHDHTKQTEASKMLFDLLATALSQHKPEVVVKTLADNQRHPKAERVSALVFLCNTPKRKRRTDTAGSSS